MREGQVPKLRMRKGANFEYSPSMECAVSLSKLGVCHG